MRCEELRWAEVDARTQAGSYKAQSHRSGVKLKAAREEVKRVRRTAKNTLALEAEVKRLRALLRDAGVDPRKRVTVTSLRMDVAHLRDELGTQKQKNRQLEKQKAALEKRKAALEKEVEALRSTGSVLSGALYGSRSERQKKPGSTRPRGQQQGKPGHGRTARPNSRRRRSVTIRPRMRACVPAAAHRMSPMAIGSPSSSRSRPMSAGSFEGAGARPATVTACLAK